MMFWHPIAPRRTLLATALLAGLAACGSAPEPASKDETPAMPDASEIFIPQDCDYSTIGDELSSSPCSPRFLNRERTGLLINAPESVSLADGPFAVNLFCTYRHRPAEPLNLNGPIESSIVFVAVDKRSNQTWSAQLPGMDNLVPEPDEGPPPSPEELEGLIVGGWVNLELVAAMGLPEQPASYVLYATVDRHKSNVLTLEVGK